MTVRVLRILGIRRKNRISEIRLKYSSAIEKISQEYTLIRFPGNMSAYFSLEFGATPPCVSTRTVRLGVNFIIIIADHGIL